MPGSRNVLDERSDRNSLAALLIAGETNLGERAVHKISHAQKGSTEYGTRTAVDRDRAPFQGLEREDGGIDQIAILVRGEDARRLNLKTISNAATEAPRWRAGFGQDFMSRADGYPGFSKTYGLKFAEVREMDLSLTYIALSSRQVDLIAGNSTEGRIPTLDLFQLADDRRYFPPYEAVYLVRQDSLTRVPALQEVLSKLANAISTDEMRRLNYEIDGKKRDPKEVVREWLKGKGF